MTDNLPPRRPASAAGLTAPARKAGPPSPLATPAGPPPSRRSAAGLSVPTKRPVRAPSAALTACEPVRAGKAWNEAVDRVRALRDSLPPEVNKNDRAVALISACILGGICTEANIVSVLRHLHFHPGHVHMTLKTGTGTSANSNWSKDANGRYRLIR